MKDQDAQMFEYTSWMTKHGGFARDMTMRDYFAAKALQGMYAKHWDMFMDDTYEAPEEAISGAANEAYALADAMLRAREQ
jgi:hypothetical protein